MKTINVFRLLLLATVISIAAGCKVAVLVVEGGEVQSIGSGTCLEGSICVHEVNDHTFNETFTAVPNIGWEFVRWNSGGDFFCEDDTSVICNVSNVGTEGVPGIEAIVNSDKVYYVMPIFSFIPGSITDVIDAPDGNQWAQIDLFAGLTHSEVAAACPAGACAGFLNGFNVDGWTWADGPTVLALWNAYSIGYIYPTVLAVGSGAYDLMETAGWRKTQTSEYAGMTSDSEAFAEGFIAFVCIDGCGEVYSIGSNPPGSFGVSGGIWLFR